MSRKLVWMENLSFHGFGCSDCNWVYKSSGPLVSASLDEMKRKYEIERDKEFASHVCIRRIVKDEPVNEGNPLLMEPRIFVTPHIAGSTDLMLDGTVRYLGEVLARYRDGFQSESIVNEPRRPRVPLRESPN